MTHENRKSIKGFLFFAPILAFSKLSNPYEKIVSPGCRSKNLGGISLFLTEF